MKFINDMSWKKIIISFALICTALLCLNFLIFGLIFHHAGNRFKEMADRHQRHFEQSEKELAKKHEYINDEFAENMKRSLAQMNKDMDEMRANSRKFEKKFNLRAADSYCTFQDPDAMHAKTDYATSFSSKDFKVKQETYFKAEAHCICRVLAAKNPTTKNCEAVILSGSDAIEPKDANDVMPADPLLMKKFHSDSLLNSGVNDIKNHIEDIKHELPQSISQNK